MKFFLIEIFKEDDNKKLLKSKNRLSMTQYLKLLNTSEFGENPAVSFCFDLLQEASKNFL